MEDQGSGHVIEQVLPMVRLQGAGLRVVYAELDGHALRTRTVSGTSNTFEVLGAYGMPVLGVGSAYTWALDHLHGAEPDRDDDILHHGARHMVLRDGMWMQPEPLLHLGLTNGDLNNPIGFSGLYAAGNTNVFSDVSGWEPFTKDAVSRGATELDVSAEMEAAIGQVQAETDLAAAGPSPPGAKPVEAGMALSWGGPDGQIAPSGTIITGVSGMEVPGQEAGNLHGYSNELQGPSVGSKVNGQPTDESAAQLRAQSDGATVSIVTHDKGGISMISVVNNGDGTTTTRAYSHDTQAGVLRTAPTPATQSDVQSTFTPIDTKGP